MCFQVQHEKLHDNARILGGQRQSQDEFERFVRPLALQSQMKLLCSKTASAKTAKERLARPLVAKDQFDAAEELLGPVKPGETPSLDSLKLRADIQIGKKKWDEAAATLKRAVALAPQDAKLHGGLGRVYLQQRDFKNAELELKNSLRIEPNSLGGWKDLSTTYYLAGNYPATLSVLDVTNPLVPQRVGTTLVVR